MKTCTKCKKELNLTEFGFYNKPKGILRSDCKKCYAELKAKHYSYNKEEYRLNQVARRNRNREFVRTYLENSSCDDCGIADWRILEFDHVIGIKEHNISQMIGDRSPIKQLEKEIEKCEVVCANCHRLRTHIRQNNYRVQ